MFVFLNVDNPWVAWLVYRGQLVSAGAVGEPGALSYWHANYLLDAARGGSRAAYWRAELEIEATREASFPDRVSRLKGLYLFEDEQSARRAGRRWDGNFSEEHLAEVEPAGRPKVSRYDSQWITHRMADADRSWIPRYLAGEPMGPDPLWELLVEGRGYVLGTRVRERAYETVKEHWPRSLGLLELSRIAESLGSDLGLHVPLLWTEGDFVRLHMVINVEDMKDPEFLAKFQAYDGPWNRADLNAHTDLVLPDISEFALTFRIDT